MKMREDSEKVDLKFSKLKKKNNFRKLKQGLCINLEGWDGEGISKQRGYVYTYGWFMLMFDRKQQSSVKQLSFNLKKSFF